MTPDYSYALEAINLKDIPSKIKKVLENLGRLIKSFFEKIKAFFQKTQTFQMPYDIYKEGVDLDNDLSKMANDAILKNKVPDMDEVFQRFHAFQTAGNRLGSGSHGKMITLSEGTINGKARNIQDLYNNVIKAINALNGNPLGGAYADKMDSFLYAAKILQHRIMIYTHFMTYYGAKQSVESATA